MKTDGFHCSLYSTQVTPPGELHHSWELTAAPFQKNALLNNLGGQRRFCGEGTQAVSHKQVHTSEVCICMCTPHSPSDETIDILLALSFRTNI